MIAACEPGWTLFLHGICYRAYNSRTSWNVARAACKESAPPDKDGDLATIPDEATNSFLVGLTTRPVSTSLLLFHCYYI